MAKTNVILLCLMMKPKGITTVILAGKQPMLFNEHIFQEVSDYEKTDFTFYFAVYLFYIIFL